MNRLMLLIISAVSALAQNQPQPLRVTEINGLVATTVIDNRSIERSCTNYSIYGIGTGIWSAEIQKGATAAGPWISFVGTAGLISNSSQIPVGQAFGPSPFVRVLITGGAAVSFSCWKGAFISPTGISGGVVAEYFEQSFTSTTSVSILQTDYEYPGGNIVVSCLNTSYVLIPCGSIIVNLSNYNVTVGFVTPQSGFVRIFGGLGITYSKIFSSATTLSIPASEHQLINPLSIACYDAAGSAIEYGDVAFTPALIESGGTAQRTFDISLSFATPQSGRCVIWSSQ
jgi:hypothetical protein